MKLLQKIMAGLATAGFMVAQPVAAQAAANNAVERLGAPASQSEQLRGSGGHLLLILGIVGALLLLAEVTGLIDVFGNDDELPHSP
jgi:hypothetical protein